MSGAHIAGAEALELSLIGKSKTLATMCIGVGRHRPTGPYRSLTSTIP